MEPTIFADGSDVGSERKQGVRDDFKFLAQAIGGVELPFTELSCEIFLTACETDGQVSGILQMRTVAHELPRVPRGRTWPLASIVAATKYQKLRGFGTKRIHYLSVLEVRSPQSGLHRLKPRCW